MCGCQSQALTDPTLHCRTVVLLTSDVKYEETTGREGGRGDKTSSWHQAVAPAWFHTAWCFCLEKRQTPDGGKTEKKKKKLCLVD